MRDLIGPGRIALTLMRVPRYLQRRRPGQAQHRMFGSDISRQFRRAPGSSEVDAVLTIVPPPAWYHPRQHILQSEKNALHIHQHQAIEDVIRIFMQRD